jgi:hypothetical protein
MKKKNINLQSTQVSISDKQIFFLTFGPSGVHALPLAAGINEGGHYFRYIIPLFLTGEAWFNKWGCVCGEIVF